MTEECGTLGWQKTWFAIPVIKKFSGERLAGNSFSVAQGACLMSDGQGSIGFPLILMTLRGRKSWLIVGVSIRRSSSLGQRKSGAAGEPSYLHTVDTGQSLLEIQQALVTRTLQL